MFYITVLLLANYAWSCFDFCFIYWIRYKRSEAITVGDTVLYKTFLKFAPQTSIKMNLKSLSAIVFVSCFELVESCFKQLKLILLSPFGIINVAATQHVSDNRIASKSRCIVSKDWGERTICRHHDGELWHSTYRRASQSLAEQHVHFTCKMTIKSIFCLVVSSSRNAPETNVVIFKGLLALTAMQQMNHFY
jgi:hypothetical protein